jgi:hypothetical protein
VSNIGDVPRSGIEARLQWLDAAMERDTAELRAKYSAAKTALQTALLRP